MRDPREWPPPVVPPVPPGPHGPPPPEDAYREWGPPIPPPPGAGPHFAPRVRRGDVRAALLTLLQERARNGYQMIQEIHARSAGIWRPSPGAVYPALQQLEDEGLVSGEEAGGSRIYRLTTKGHDLVARRGEFTDTPWADVANTLPEEIMELRMLWTQLDDAFGQLIRHANPAQAAAARTLLKKTRRSIFAILADDIDEHGKGDT